MPEPGAPARRIGGYLSRLSLPALALIGVMVAGGVGAGGYYAYRTYDYVQHDNDFCMSCHLMQEPYELFAKSAHRGLGCKACHQPTFLVRSQMALTQIIEDPDSLAVHAEVPNERCTDCHVNGDPEKWRSISNSAGHRVHFESTDPALQGLKCVECHSSSLHEFAPIDKTCAQSGCHEDSTIKLGAMSRLTIHCAACHTFVAPVADTASALGGDRTALDDAILPDRDECLSCHEMRVLVEMPDPDPHKGVCSACHNPHVQSTPQEAVQSCATGGCHTDLETLTPFHRGMQPGVLENCLNCHVAHDFHVDGNRCLDCHRGIMGDSLAVIPPGRESPGGSGGAVAAAHPQGFLGAPSAPHAGALLGLGVGLGLELPPAPVQERPAFRHSQHRDVECGNCHVSTERHGGLSVSTLADCRGCHHTAPVSASCSRCHEPSDAPERTFREVRAVAFSVGGPKPRRPMSFPHVRHADLDCASCHTDGLALGASAVDCAACHEDHHRAESTCTACHQAPPAAAHPPAEAHVTCSGAGCHTSMPFDAVPRTRSSCLVCHQTMTDHRPGRECEECHTLPRPRPVG